MENHITLYLDFLGFSAAVNSADDRRLHEIAEILKWLSRNAREFELNGQSQDDGSYRISFNPAISSFSDHVVISCPVEHFEVGSPIIRDGWIDAVLRHLQQLVAVVSMKAFYSGFLIRGGLTVGRLIHTKEVVLGQALIEAYEIECSRAVGPRILASAELLKRFPSAASGPLLRDADGQYHLDYFYKTLEMQEDSLGREGAIAWLASVLNRCERFAGELSANGSCSAANKWSEYARYMREEADRFF